VLVEELDLARTAVGDLVAVPARRGRRLADQQAAAGEDIRLRVAVADHVDDGRARRQPAREHRLLLVRVDGDALGDGELAALRDADVAVKIENPRVADQGQ
jgi:hypothetical protein